MTKFVLGVPKWKFSTRKKHLSSGKKIRKNDFAPSKKISYYAPENQGHSFIFFFNNIQKHSHKLWGLEGMLLFSPMLLLSFFFAFKSIRKMGK